MDKIRLVSPSENTFNRMITDMPENGVFIFGSNTEGKHYGGAAAVAFKLFEAEWGVAYGMTGRCYAIPTMRYVSNTQANKVSNTELESSFDDLLGKVVSDPDKIFYLTPVGCGIAGWRPEDVVAVFQKSLAKFDWSEGGKKIPSNLFIHKQLTDLWK